MMQLKIWPEQFGYEGDDFGDDPQLVLPGLAPLLAGGDEFMQTAGFT